MNIVINEELKAYIDPLTPEEDEALERSLLAEGCRDALVLWGQVLVDGHNRYRLCMKHGLPFKTLQHPQFKALEDVHLWMIDQHLGRRSVSDFQRGLLALRKREIIDERLRRQLAKGPVSAEAPEPVPVPTPLSSREAVAKAAKLSASQVQQIERIQKSATPELVTAVRTGAISINAAAAVASLSAQEQQAAVAGGKDELKQAAKRVREARVKPKTEISLLPVAASAPGTPAASAVMPPWAENSANDELIGVLQARIDELEAEVIRLRMQLQAQTQPVI